MEFILIAFLITVLSVLVFFIVKIIKWLTSNKKRQIRSLALLLILSVSVVIKQLFFVNMEFIQSKVYPDLYLIKHPEKDETLLKKAIKQKITEEIKNKTVLDTTFTLRFYEYTNNWKFNLFADEGTAHFIENEEDIGGFVSEELSMYPQYRLGFFYFVHCKTHSTKYCGKIDFFKEGNFEKTEAVVINNQS